MTRWATWVIGSTLALLVGCSGEASDSTGDQNAGGSGVGSVDGSALGGQTGSLVPDCELAPATQAGVPEGDAFVVYGQGCDEAATDGRLTITDPDDESVEIMLEPLEGSPDAYVVRTTASLEAGQYAVSLPHAAATMTTPGAASSVTADTSTMASSTASEPLTVIEATPLPASLGSVEEFDDAGACSQLGLRLTLADSALAYAALLRLSIRVNGSEPVIIYNYGAVSAEARRILLPFDRCTDAWDCLDEGPHEAQVVAEIAGEELGPEPLNAPFTVNCSELDATSGCAIRAGGSRRSIAQLSRPSDRFAIIALALCAALVRRRSRKSHPAREQRRRPPSRNQPELDSAAPRPTPPRPTQVA